MTPIPDGDHAPLDPEDLRTLRRALAGRHGQDFWRALEALAPDPAFRRFLESHYPALAARLDGVPRRDFLRLMGASLGLAGFAACTRQPDERILPAARAPEYAIPGKPRFFATAMPLGGYATGLLVESHEGRPTKVEGNPDHPASLGATDAFAQAAILSLYDPDRSHSIRRDGYISTWGTFLDELVVRLDGLRARSGDGLSILVDDTVSPTLEGQLEALTRDLPLAKVHRWTPLHADAARAGSRLAFGREVATRYAFDRARCIVSLDADFLASGPAPVRYAHDFAAARRPAGDPGAPSLSTRDSMARLYCVESVATLTGAMADARIGVRPSKVEGVARALAAELGLEVAVPHLTEAERAFAARAARALAAERGRSVVVPGETATPAVHALAHALNARLGAVGITVEFTEPLGIPADCTESLRELVDHLRGGSVDTLVVLGGNPVYDAPADLDFASALLEAPFRVHLSERFDETSRLCTWHLPRAHFLESWSDALAYDGTATILQPLIAPLYEGRTPHEIVATLSGTNGAKPYDLVREHWRNRFRGSEEDFELHWRKSLHDGVVPDTRAPALSVKVRDLEIGPPPRSSSGLELAFRPDPAVFDGRFANNGWLQETPRPLTRLTWDNVCWMAPRNAREQGLRSGDVVLVVAGDRQVEAPVWITPGQPEGSIGLQLGYGRTSAGELANGVGYDAYRLRTSYLPWAVADITVRPTGKRAQLASVQDHARMEGRDLVRVQEPGGSVHASESSAHGAPDPSHPEEHPSLYPGYAYEETAWGMVIDLNACIGCNACMVACQAENNVPIVGKVEVSRGREMHWLRIDRYYEASSRDETGEEDPRVLHQPVLCMHCENAPCEVVCPVGATVHSSEGLNEMVYNRCVGTRYCSNNCPYKVRRFNFFHYADYETESLKLGRNPDVTVRSRGVMEKCTYCVQRISAARIAAKEEGRSIAEGDVVTACQQVCPTRAIAFGNINDAGSRVHALRAQDRHYELLGETGTRPRTTYLAKLINPDRALER